MEYVLIEDTGQVACRRSVDHPFFLRKDGKWHESEDFVLNQLFKGEAKRLGEKEGRNAHFESGDGGNPEKDLPE